MGGGGRGGGGGGCLAVRPRSMLSLDLGFFVAWFLESSFFSDLIYAFCQICGVFKTG